MLITHIGHAEFLLETQSGYSIVTDPYDKSCGYPIRNIPADAVLVSHHHHDHDATENVAGSPRIIDTAGLFSLETDVKVTAVEGDHDDAQGTKRGKTLLFRIDTEGLRIVHLGDLGCELSEEQVQALKQPDILMVPIGGFYTIDAEQAQKTAERLQARVIIPMHYRTAYNSDWPIETEEAFLKLFDEKEIRRGGDALRVTAGDLSCQPHIVVI